MGTREDAMYEYRREGAGVGDELRGCESDRDPSVVQELLGPRGRGDGSSGGAKKKKLDDETRLNLGTTIRILKERLPTILQQPLPSEILADNISLHLFPSTHPHLPVANGKAAYKAALWTSPLAWNRLPIIGNVGLEVQSIRLQPGPLPFTPLRTGSLEDMLVVRWVTEPSSLPSEFLRNMAARIGGGSQPAAQEFMGLFAFQFDNKGRVLDHTIESAEHSRHWSKGMGSSVVRFTDKLLGGIRQRGEPDPVLFPACSARGRGGGGGGGDKGDKD
ncbi:unnamed protein product [Parascedosporium putredinis]|uniref:Uncharacterized protein n=1 Tax=Parascedosporium putredinis TaxID=1442378 RepID=A0A9P1GXF6_9PEZI|nr:unnamed protein product [Parascedosporium putredinis]CAI7990548.1 unnamed protein product [Parascedosporium putredinis]